MSREVLSEGGEMGALMRSIDWAKTPLGPVDGWSQALRTMVGLLLRNRFPLLLWWGPHFVQLYNDAYRPILRPRRGELAALSHLDPRDAARVLPILELEAGPGIVPLIRRFPPQTGAIAIDFGAVPEPRDPLTLPSLDLAEELAELGVAMLPVLRAYDTDRRLLAHGLAARMHLRRAVLRQPE